MCQEWLWYTVMFADDGFGNLIKLSMLDRMKVLDVCFQDSENII